MAAADREAHWPGALALIGVVTAGVAVGVVGSAGADELSDAPHAELVSTGLSWPLGAGAVSDRITADLAVNNHGDADFDVTNILVRGWNVADPEEVTATIAAGEWVHFTFDMIADCDVPGSDAVALVDARGEPVQLEASGFGLASIQQRACLFADGRAPGSLTTVADVAARADSGGDVLHIDVDLAHPESAGADLSLAAVTGHASGFTVELPHRLTELASGATTTVTTDWRVRDCGGAAGTTVNGDTDQTSSGNFEGLTLHLYWQDPERELPVRTDLAVQLPPEAIVALARFAVDACSAPQ